MPALLPLAAAEVDIVVGRKVPISGKVHCGKIDGESRRRLWDDSTWPNRRADFVPQMLDKQFCDRTKRSVPQRDQCYRKTTNR